MGEAACKLEWRPDLVANTDEDNLLILMRQPAHSGLIAASGIVVGTSQAVHWYDLEVAAEAFLDANRVLAGTRRLDAVNARLLEDAQQLLQRKSADAAEVYTELATDLVGRAQSWGAIAPHDEVTYCLHAGLVWQTLLHLLSAGVPVRRIIPLLEAGRTPSQTPRAAWTPHASVAATSVQQMMGLGARRTQALVVHSANGASRLWTALQQRGQRHRARRHAKAAAMAERREITKQASLAVQEAEAARQRAAAAEHSPPITEQTFAEARRSSALALDGARLRGNVFLTWLMLVVLSWVSLIWGALISMPVGVGFGILASMFVGIFVVPLWGTFWGFVGMSAATSGTLRHMGFREVPEDHPLRATCKSYARALGIPCPQLGFIPVHNAFAMGVHESYATVAIGKPLLKQLSEDEVAAVLGHELGHVISGDMRRMMLMRTFQNACVWYGMAQGLKQFARWVICWATELSILAFSRRREYWADAIGAALAGKEAMIGALQKLEHAPRLTSEEKTHARFMFRGRASSLLSTHPSFHARINALQQETYIRKLPVKRRSPG